MDLVVLPAISLIYTGLVFTGQDPFHYVEK